MKLDHPLDELETTHRSLHRAQTESFAFRLHDGDVIVQNLTYDDPSEHEYRISVIDGVPADCTCPAEAQFAPACKHRVAVAIRDRVIAAAVRMQVATDGGQVPSVHSPTVATGREGEHDDSDCDLEGGYDDSDCDCNGLPDGVPCWPCYRDGRASFAD